MFTKSPNIFSRSRNNFTRSRNSSTRSLGYAATLTDLFFRGESPGCRLFSTVSMLEGLRNSSTTTHRGVLRKDGAEITWGRPLPDLEHPPLFLIIQWRRQRHLTWSSTHDVVSREINLCKSFDLLLGSNQWTKCRMFNRQATGAHYAATNHVAMLYTKYYDNNHEISCLF